MNFLAAWTTAWVLQLSTAGGVTSEDPVLYVSQEACEETAMQRIAHTEQPWGCREAEVKMVSWSTMLNAGGYGVGKLQPVGPALASATHHYINGSPMFSPISILENYQIIKYKD